MKKIACVIQARVAGGKRVPRKMVRPFAGTCLLRIALEKIVKCENIEKENIFLVTNEDEIKEIAAGLNINIYNRPQESLGLADDNLQNILQHYFKWAYDLKFDHYLQINACNPMLSIESIDKAIEVFNNNDYNSLFSVVRRKNFYFDKNSHVINEFNGNNAHFYGLDTRQVEPIFEAAHSIYIFNMAYFKNNKYGARWSFSLNDPFLFEIPPEEAFDIDYPWQFDLAEKVYLQKFGRV